MREIPFDYIGASWMIVFLLPLLFIRVNKWLNPFIIYSYLLGIFITESPFIRTDFPLRVFVAAQNQALGYLVLLLIFVLVMKLEIPTEKIEKFLAYLGAFNILLTVALTPLDQPFISGIIFNKSMNAIFNLMLLPYVLARFKSVALLFFCVATVIHSQSSSGMIALTLMACYFFRKNKLLVVLFAVACVLLRCVVMHRPIPYMDRIDGWLFFFKTFTVRDWIFGRGPGAFFSYGVFEQHTANFNVSQDLKSGNGLFVWLHNDYLQALYEFGACGIMCLIPALYHVVKKANNLVTYTLIPFLVGCAFYYPSHWSFHLVVAFCVLKIVDNNYKLSQCEKLAHGSIG